jgi:hypothetical protein
MEVYAQPKTANNANSDETMQQSKNLHRVVMTFMTISSCSMCMDGL